MQNEPTPVTDASVGLGGEGPLAEIDRLLQKRRDDQQRSSERSAQLRADRSEFSTEFAKVCNSQVHPPMERSSNDSAATVVEVSSTNAPRDLSRHHTHRLTLWMSLSGEIAGTPRQDRPPIFNSTPTWIRAW